MILKGGDTIFPFLKDSDGNLASEGNIIGLRHPLVILLSNLECELTDEPEPMMKQTGIWFDDQNLQQF